MTPCPVFGRGGDSPPWPRPGARRETETSETRGWGAEPGIQLPRDLETSQQESQSL